MTARFALAALIASSFAVASPASAYVASNGLLVVPTGPTAFDVPFAGISGDTQFWCAAGDYVIGALRLPRSTRIYRMSEPPRRSGEGISFSLSSEGAASKSGILVMGAPDQSISASMAQSFCEALWPWGRFGFFR